MTMIFSFLSRSGWSAAQEAVTGIIRIGTQGVAEENLGVILNGTLDNLIWIRAYDNAGATWRYEYHIGDEAGGAWSQDKWYQVGVSISSTEITYCVNGSTSGGVTITTNNPGALSLNHSVGSERCWIHAPSAAWPKLWNAMNTANQNCPSVIFGPAAYHSTAIDFNSQAVRDNIWDSDGNFLNPYEDGSRWFSGTSPDIYLLNGSGEVDNGSFGAAWKIARVGQSDEITGPTGGLRKQYE
jgi:hypothetical protein